MSTLVVHELDFASSPGILARAALDLPPKHALPILRCCHAMHVATPSCLASATSWVWVMKNMDLISLGQLRDMDFDVCQCLREATRDSFAIDYGLDWRAEFVFKVECKGDQCYEQLEQDDAQESTRINGVIKTTVPDMVERANLWHCLELGTKR
eukprot:6482468-Amphidinium_carterae.1